MTFLLFLIIYGYFFYIYYVKRNYPKTLNEYLKYPHIVTTVILIISLFNLFVGLLLTIIFHIFVRRDLKNV